MRDREHELGRSRRGSGPLRPRDGEPERPDMETQIEALASQIRRLGERLADAGKPPRPEDVPVGRGEEQLEGGITLLGERVIVAAEAAADQIRESAKRAAEQIRARGQRGDGSRIAELRAMTARHRKILGLLIGETTELERRVELMRTQLGVLGAELLTLDDSLRELDEAG
jgi:uncharacterized coiled-coil protein SlyX